MNTKTITLTNDDGDLAYNGGVLLYWHKSGDVDVVSYPRPNLKHLRAALYDAREMGFIPRDVGVAKLPSGKTVCFDVA